MNLDVHDFKKESVEAYSKASAFDPKDFRWVYYSALALNDVGSSDARSMFQRSCELKPDYAPARLRYAQQLLEQNRIEEALEQFQKIKPASAQSYLGVARILLLRGDLDQALKYSVQAIRLRPDYSEAHGLLSQIYRRKNEIQKANDELILSQQFPSKFPSDDPVLADLIAEGVSSYWYEWRGRAYLDRGHYEAAIQQLKTAIELSPDARLHDLLGVAFQNTKQYQAAAEQYRLALSKENSAPRMNNLAAALFELGQRKQAFQYLEEAIQLDPEFAYSYFHSSILHLRAGDPSNAVAVLLRGHERLPENGVIALRLSWLLATLPDQKLRNGSQAVHLAEQVCKANQFQDPECIDILAAAHAEAGNFGESVRLAKQAYQIAISKKNGAFAERIEAHLKNYEAGKPYRE